MKINKLGFLVSIGVISPITKKVMGQQVTPNITNIHTEISSDSLINLIQKYLVTSDEFYRNTLYSWTSQKQLAQIKEGGKILIKGRGEKEISFYENSLNSKKMKNHPLSKILQEDKFQNKRFCWTNSWAISSGEKDYGNVLLQIKLKDTALICKINPFFPENIQVLDNKGTIISLEDINAVKDRIAAVYYINDYLKTKRFTKTQPTTIEINKKFEKELKETFFREYVIVNENMIEYVLSDSDETIKIIQQEIDFLTLLSTELIRDSDKAKPFVYNWYTEYIWSNNSLNKDDLSSLYYHSLAFPNKSYELNLTNIQNLIKVMDEKIIFLKNAQ